MLNKLHSILTGWKNLVFEDTEIESMAKARAVECAKCDNSEFGLIPALIDDEIKDIKGLYCNKCSCPLSAKLRSPEESCPKRLWLERIK